jgi:hypothetical protein
MFFYRILGMKAIERSLRLLLFSKSYKKRFEITR